MLHLDNANQLQVEAQTLVGQRIAVMGKSGSGKTNTLFVFAEEWMKAGLPLVIVDPMGQFRRLRKAGFPILVAGKRKDADAGISAALATFVFEQRLPIILDLSLYQDGADMDVLAEFLSAFWECVFQQEEDEAQPFALLLDEAHLYAPQGAVTPISGLIKKIAKLGRHKAFTTMVASQRAASIDKDFLTQANLMIAHRVMLQHDAATLAESIPLTQRELLATMRKFGKGEAFVVGDAEIIGTAEDYLRLQVRLCTALDLNAPVVLEPCSLPQIDEKLLEALATLAEGEKPAEQGGKEVWKKQIADRDQTIGELRREITRLEQQIRLLEERPNVVTPVEVHQPLLLTVEDTTFVRETTTTTTTREINHRSSRALQMAVNRQTKAFGRFLLKLDDMWPMHRRILVYMIEIADKSVTVRELARRLDYSEGRVSSAARDLFTMGLLQRLATAEYRSDVRHFLAEEYPDLQVDGLFDQLLTTIMEEV